MTEPREYNIENLTSFRAREMFDGRFDLTIVSEHNGRTDETTFHDIRNFQFYVATDRTRRIELTIYK